MQNVGAAEAMPPSVSQSAARANPKRQLRDVGLTAGLTALLLSLVAHGALVGATALRGARLEPPPPPATTAPLETDLVDVERSSGDAVLRGDETKAQGTPTNDEGPAAAAAPKEPAAAKAPTPAPDRPPVAPPAPTPPPTTSPPPAPTPPPTTSPALPDAPPSPPALPRDPDAEAQRARERASKRASDRRSASTSASATPASSSGAAPSSTSEGAGGPPGDGGGQRRRGERDLASTLTFELPDCAFYVDAWSALPLGDAGTILATIEVGADGRVTSAAPEPNTTPPAPFVDTLRRVAGRLKVSKLSLENGVLDEGSLHVRISATVSEVPVPDRPGGAVAIEHTFDKGRGRASFTLESGRRVEFVISVVKVEHAT